MKLFLRLILVSSGVFFVYLNATAQVDFGTLSLAFSQTGNGGTARVNGFGGANTALGGDLSSILSNPAGLGFYNRSDVSLTPVISIHSNSTDYLGSTMNSSESKFSLGNLGIVFNKTKSDEVPGNWRGGNFGFSYNRINAFNDDINYAGKRRKGKWLKCREEHWRCRLTGRWTVA